MEHIKQKGESFFDHLSGYIDTQFKLFNIRAVEKTSDYVASLVTAMLGIIFFALVFLFIGLGLGFWLGYELENLTAGFLLVAVFYAIVLLTILALRKSFTLRIIRDIIIKKKYGQDN